MDCMFHLLFAHAGEIRLIIEQQEKQNQNQTPSTSKTTLRASTDRAQRITYLDEQPQTIIWQVSECRCDKRLQRYLFSPGDGADEISC